MNREETNNEAAVALQALAWILSDEVRTDRLLALTGLTPEALRADLSKPSLQAAVLRFLEAHEPDLIACAQALSLPPLALIDAAQRLENPPAPKAPPVLRTGRSIPRP